jgi:hypothetical protein
MLSSTRLDSTHQPQSTHMDLNIGTAFWFASRGRGYTCQDQDQDYPYHLPTSGNPEEGGEKEELEVLQEDGRPLLRRGGEGYARGRGEKPKLSRREDQQFLVNSCVDGVDKESTTSVTSSGNKSRIPCHNAECGQISKPGCVHDLCKRCCVKRFKAQNESMHDLPGCNHLSLSSNIEQCPVHKKKSKNNKAISEPSVDAPPYSTAAGISSSSSSSSSVLNKWHMARKRRRSPYVSRCKVLLVGIGADEQLGGYSRHRSVYQRGGQAALRRELCMDTARIYNRNLGR